VGYIVREDVGGASEQLPSFNSRVLITREIPRLCRGGSRSLTFRAVAHGGDFQS
jgi:hypothetical protein